MDPKGKSIAADPPNVICLSTILSSPFPFHKCDRKCKIEHVWGNMYRCKRTRLSHICDKNCDQRIPYDNHNSLCRVSGQIFPLTPEEQQQVGRGVRRSHDEEKAPTDSCASKRRRDA